MLSETKRKLLALEKLYLIRCPVKSCKGKLIQTANDFTGPSSNIRYRCLTCNVAFEITNPSYIQP